MVVSKHICFVVPGAYNVLSGRRDLRRIGGAEVQVVSLARAMVARGHRVSCVTWDHGQPDGELHDGIRVFKSFSPDGGMPIVRFFHPRWTMLNAAMKRAGADVYVQACADALTGQVGMWCRRNHRSFMFLIMLDGDCDSDLPYLKTRRERFLYRRGLVSANSVIAQTDVQRRLLRDWLSLSSEVVAPCGGRPDDDLPLARFAGDRPRVLWLGRFVFQKRIEWLLELARMCPEIDFDVVGGANADDPYARRLLDEAGLIPNVQLHGAVPHASVGEFYARAQALVLTSHVEGFPTVFIEAWSWGLPTVSTVDVDGTIEREGLGGVAGSVRDLCEALRRVVCDEACWSGVSRRARAHYTKQHTPDAAASAIERVLTSLDPRSPSPPDRAGVAAAETVEC